MLIIWHFKVGSRSTTYFQPHIVTICGPPETWKFVFFINFVNRSSQISLFLDISCILDPLKMNKNWYFYIFQPGSRAHGSRSTWNFISLLWSHGCISRLEINNMQRYWSDLNVLWMPRLSSQWLLSKMHLKSLSGRQDGHPPSSWDGAIISQNPSHSHFWTFFGEIMTYSRERDVITMGIPPKSGIPHDFIPILYRNIHSNTLIWSKDTCFVQNFDKSLSPPPLLPPSPPPSLLHPLPPPSCPFPQPLPPTILPPCQK